MAFRSTPIQMFGYWMKYTTKATQLVCKIRKMWSRITMLIRYETFANPGIQGSPGLRESGRSGGYVDDADNVCGSGRRQSQGDERLTRKWIKPLHFGSLPAAYSRTNGTGDIPLRFRNSICIWKLEFSKYQFQTLIPRIWKWYQCGMNIQKIIFHIWSTKPFFTKLDICFHGWLWLFFQA